jgi:hypothetical protein
MKISTADDIKKFRIQKKVQSNLTAEISSFSYSNAVNSQHDMDMERVNETESRRKRRRRNLL